MPLLSLTQRSNYNAHPIILSITLFSFTVHTVLNALTGDFKMIFAVKPLVDEGKTGLDNKPLPTHESDIFGYCSSKSKTKRLLSRGIAKFLFYTVVVDNWLLLAFFKMERLLRFLILANDAPRMLCHHDN